MSTKTLGTACQCLQAHTQKKKNINGPLASTSPKPTTHRFGQALELGELKPSDFVENGGLGVPFKVQGLGMFGAFGSRV